MSTYEELQIILGVAMLIVAILNQGSHRQYKHPSKPGKVTIPFHNGDVDKGTADSILKQAGLK